MSPGKKLEEIRQEKGLTGVKTCDCFSLFLLIDRAGVWLLSNGLLCNQPIRIPCNYLSLTQSAGKSRSHKQGATGFGFACHCLKNWLF